VSHLTIPKPRDVVADIPDVLSAEPEAQHAWLCAMGASLGAWHKIKVASTMKEAEILYYVSLVWPSSDKAECVSADAVLPWDGDYYRWARTFTKKQGREPANITIANKVTVYRDWVAEGNLQYPETVSVPKRDENGHQRENLAEEGAWVEVPFDPVSLDYGKLLVARGAARREEMTPEAWTALADPYSTVQDLKGALFRDPVRSRRHDGLRIWVSDGIFYATLDAETTAFAMLLNDNMEMVSAQKGTARVLASFGAEMPEDVIPVESLVNVPLAVASESSLVLSSNGQRFLELSDEKDLILLQDVLQQVLADRGLVAQF
jgi:hypothetical protein